MSLTTDQLFVSALFIVAIWIAAIYSLYKKKKEDGMKNSSRGR